MQFHKTSLNLAICLANAIILLSLRQLVDLVSAEKAWGSLNPQPSDGSYNPPIHIHAVYAHPPLIVERGVRRAVAALRVEGQRKDRLATRWR